MTGPPLHTMWPQLQNALERVEELSKAHQALAKRVVVLEGRNAPSEKTPDTPMPDVVKTGKRPPSNPVKSKT